MFPRNKLQEKREAAAIAKHARIQICARSSPISRFLLRNTQGTHLFVTNEGPGMNEMKEMDWNGMEWNGMEWNEMNAMKEVH